MQAKRLQPRASAAQQEHLYSFMRDHPQITRAASDFTGGVTRESKEKLWRQLTAELNALGPATKSPARWRHYWTDKVSWAKKKAVDFRQSSGWVVVTLDPWCVTCMCPSLFGNAGLTEPHWYLEGALWSPNSRQCNLCIPANQKELIFRRSCPAVQAAARCPARPASFWTSLATTHLTIAAPWSCLVGQR